jgi:hypothetical protein
VRDEWHGINRNISAAVALVHVRTVECLDKAASGSTGDATSCGCADDQNIQPAEASSITQDLAADSMPPPTCVATMAGCPGPA